jgi:hypothetical protein
VKKHFGLMLGFLLFGCDDPLKTVELVAEPRVLGARVEVAGEPERAAPAPGEDATVTFLLGSPALAQTLGFALAACPAAERRGSRTACAGNTFASVSSADGELASASLDFTVPDDLDPSGRVAILGILCPSGSPGEDGTSCDGPEPGREVTLELELSRDGDVNHNPTLEPAALSFDGAEWPDLPAMDGDCAGQGYVEVPVSSQHAFSVALDENDRDALPHPQELDPTRESLQLSHFVTGGDLSRAFETVAWDSDELSRESSWTAPKTPGLVRFWLVLRDFRGGSDFLERDVCVQ